MKTNSSNHNFTTPFACIGLGTGVIFGLSGMFFTEPLIQQNLFMISSMGLVIGTALLAVRYLREQQDLLATGFLVFAIGESICAAGIAADPQTEDATFASAMLFYVAGLLFILIPQYFPLLVRVLGIAASIPFLLAAGRFFLGHGISSADMLPGMGYGLLSLTLLGMIYSLSTSAKSLQAKLKTQNS